jgi:release factor glutamine methyltransferase
MNGPTGLVTDGTTSVLRPSEYTGALIQALRAAPGRVAGANVLEIGSGSGVVLAALGALGAASLCGIDVESEAVAAGASLLHSLGHGSLAQFHRGDMWQPVCNRRFDLIVANLPHFPMHEGKLSGRRTSWSSGGLDGRLLLDRFLDGLSDHLARGGAAVITHNAFVGLDRTREMLRPHGLAANVASTTLVHIPAEKLALMTRGVLAAEDGRTIHRYGPYVFADMYVVEIAVADGVA